MECTCVTNQPTPLDTTELIVPGESLQAEPGQGLTDPAIATFCLYLSLPCLVSDVAHITLMPRLVLAPRFIVEGER